MRGVSFPWSLVGKRCCRPICRPCLGCGLGSGLLSENSRKKYPWILRNGAGDWVGPTERVDDCVQDIVQDKRQEKIDEDDDYL